MAKSRPATAARGPQARGLPWRAEMQPNCPGYQERLCLSSWNRYSTRTGKARKNRTRKESFLARKNDRNFQPCEIANIRPRAEICNLTWLGISWFSAGEASSGSKFKGTCEIAESRNVHPSIWLVSAMVTDMWHMISMQILHVEAQWPIGYGVGLRIKRSSVRIRPWPLRWVLGQGSLLPLSKGEAFTLASISYLAILVKYILAICWNGTRGCQSLTVGKITQSLFSGILLFLNQT